MQPTRLSLPSLPLTLSNRLTSFRVAFFRFRPGLSLKLILVVVAVALIGILTSSTFMFSSLREQYIDQVKASTARSNRMLIAGLEHDMLMHDSSMVNMVIQDVTREFQGEEILILDAQGYVRGSSQPAEFGNLLPKTSPKCGNCHMGGTGEAKLTNTIVRSPDTREQTLLSVSPIANKPECTSCHAASVKTLGVLYTQAPLTDLNELTQEGLRRVGFAAFITFSLLVGLMVPALHKTILEPIRDLTKGVTEIGSENLDYHIHATSHDELGQLVNAFDGMREGLKSSRAVIVQRSQELSILYEVAQATSQLVELSEILNSTLDIVVQRLDLDVGIIYLWDKFNSRFDRVACRGLSKDQLAGIDQKRQQPGGDLTLEVARLGKVFFIPDVSLDHHFAGDWEDPHGRSYVNVPLMSQGKTVGTLELVSQAGQRMTSRMVEVLTVVGNQIGIAIDNHTLLAETQQMAVLEERDRLAREMHDDLAQTLGYLNIKMSITGDLVTAGKTEHAQESLMEMKEIARSAYTSTREAIFHLRNTVPLGVELIPALRQYLAEYSVNYGLDAQLVVEDEEPVKFPTDLTIQLSRIIQEGLTNIRKHAQATRAWVRFEREENGVRIVIEDNGKGFVPEIIGSNGKDHFGLQIMRERAESVGATIELLPMIGHGTRVIIHVPA